MQWLTLYLALHYISLGIKGMDIDDCRLILVGLHRHQLLMHSPSPQHQRPASPAFAYTRSSTALEKFHKIFQN